MSDQNPITAVVATVLAFITVLAAAWSVTGLNIGPEAPVMLPTVWVIPTIGVSLLAAILALGAYWSTRKSSADDGPPTKKSSGSDEIKETQPDVTGEEIADSEVSQELEDRVNTYPEDLVQDEADDPVGESSQEGSLSEPSWSETQDGNRDTAEASDPEWEDAEQSKKGGDSSPFSEEESDQLPPEYLRNLGQRIEIDSPEDQD